MSNERNFRSNYYQKVGCRNVEQRKAMDILLKANKLDKIKISQFCSRFVVPYNYRSFVWKILLGIVPEHKTSHDMIMQQRCSQYFDLLRALTAMKYVTDDSPSEQKFLQMWLLERHRLAVELDKEAHLRDHQDFLAIARTLVETFDSEVDIYWIAKGFYTYLKTWYDDIPSLIETTKTVLRTEDSVLYIHLTKTNLLNQIPMDSWFSRCFAGVIHESSLLKVWDKVIGGAYRVLIFVCSMLLSKMRKVLLTCVTMAQFDSCVKSVNDETSDVVVNKSLDMWQTHACTVVPSPVRLVAMRCAAGKRGRRGHPSKR